MLIRVVITNIILYFLSIHKIIFNLVRFLVSNLGRDLSFSSLFDLLFTSFVILELLYLIDKDVSTYSDLFGTD